LRDSERIQAGFRGRSQKVKKQVDLSSVNMVSYNDKRVEYLFLQVPIQKEANMPIQFNINTQKAIESVLWVIQNGESNMYNIWKILFSAEKYHINNHGRPITGDRYIAMGYGTVPSWLYNATNTEKSGMGFFRQDNSLVAERNPMMDYLSASDVKALKHGFDEYVGLSFNSVMEKNHGEPAWKKNYTRNSGTPIPFEDIIEEEWLKEELSLFSNSLVL
jgi:uncharacterized phage-associated protein